MPLSIIVECCCAVEIHADCRKLALYAECDYAECNCAECHYAECHYAECHGAIRNKLKTN